MLYCVPASAWCGHSLCWSWTCNSSNQRGQSTKTTLSERDVLEEETHSLCDIKMCCSTMLDAYLHTQVLKTMWLSSVCLSQLETLTICNAACLTGSRSILQWMTFDLCASHTSDEAGVRSHPCHSMSVPVSPVWSTGAQAVQHLVAEIWSKQPGFRDPGLHPSHNNNKAETGRLNTLLWLLSIRLGGHTRQGKLECGQGHSKNHKSF